MPRFLWLPNLLTLLRLLLAPFVVYAIYTGRYFLALTLFGLAAVTDILDGVAARRFGSTTSTGAFLDPIADKCLLNSVFLALAAAHSLPWWFVAVVFGRDLAIVLAVPLVMRYTSVREFPPSFWGKASTFVQISTAALWMGRMVFPGPFLTALSSAILWPCVAFTAWSGFHYAWRGITVIRKH